MKVEEYEDKTTFIADSGYSIKVETVHRSDCSSDSDYHWQCDRARERAEEHEK
ncbi:MAG: hypothetical protein J6S09_05595 [Paludibacteraceae bacterium]|nr:hypothetical protein [Paludibacteraceae bacterium]